MRSKNTSQQFINRCQLKLSKSSEPSAPHHYIKYNNLYHAPHITSHISRPSILRHPYLLLRKRPTHQQNIPHIPLQPDTKHCKALPLRRNPHSAPLVLHTSHPRPDLTTLVQDPYPTPLAFTDHSQFLAMEGIHDGRLCCFFIRYLGRGFGCSGFDSSVPLGGFEGGVLVDEVVVDAFSCALICV
jgi:hypothetical protein